MNASQDKVQGILETLLQENIPLVHKGIFTTQELQQFMHEREKHQNNMLKSSFKLSDYLKAIQYEYSLQRTRRFRISQMSVSNPLFKKQSKTDFIIIKRIIRLWDRATFKFKYSLDLWKQYLAFCVLIESKKHFYKALSAAIRIMPHEEELWKIGTQYEIQMGKNLWKARKILIRGLKLNPKKQNLWEIMLQFELYFLRTIYLREKVINGAQQPMKFIMPGEQNMNEQSQQLELGDQMIDEKEEISDGINLEKHDEVMLLVIQQAVSKFEQRQKKLQMLNRFVTIIKKEIKNQKEEFIIKVGKRLLKTVMQGIPKSQRGNVEDIQVKNIKNKVQQVSNNKLKQAHEALSHPQNHHTSKINQVIAPFLTKPKQLSQLLIPLVKKNYNFMIQYISTSSTFKSYLLPNSLLQILINHRSPSIEQSHKKYLQNQINRISTDSLRYNPKLLSAVIMFNKKQKNYKGNNAIHRKLSVCCREQPQIIQRCLHLIRSQQ